MIVRIARAGLTLAGVAALTWLALAISTYALLYRTIGTVYQNLARDVMQAECGRVVRNELIYTLAPGTCRFQNPEFDTLITADEDGFRNVPDHLGTGTVKVAVLGDSHGMGWGVAQADKLSSQMAHDARLTVRDLSMSSFGTAREMIAFQRHAADADVVVIQYCFNDLAENNAFLAGPAAFAAAAPERARQYEAEIETQRRSAGPARTLLRHGLGAMAATWRLLWLPPRSYREPARPIIDEEARRFAAVLAHFKPALAGRKVIVFDSFPRQPRASFAPTFRAALASEGLAAVTVIDLVGTIAPSDFFHIDEHMRPSGHARIARSVLDEIDSAARVPKTP